MNKIEIPAHDTVPLDHIATGLAGLRVVIVNVLGVASESGWTLVDCGLNGSAAHIKRWAHEKFGEAPPNAIVRSVERPLRG